MSLRLGLESLNAYNGKGYAVKKKEELHAACKTTYFSRSTGTKAKKMPQGVHPAKAGQPEANDVR